MGKFKEDLIEEIDSFWLNRVTTAQIIIKDKAKELIKGKFSNIKNSPTACKPYKSAFTEVFISDGNVVMTFGYSNSVYNIFSHTKFR